MTVQKLFMQKEIDKASVVGVLHNLLDLKYPVNSSKNHLGHRTFASP